MENVIMNYLKPELVVLIPVLYFIGMAFKKGEFIKDKHIPTVLGVISIVLVFVYLIATEGWNVNVIWLGIVQGVLAAAGSVYANQIIKQSKKDE